MSKPDQA